jgi:hypothetical protein
MCITLLTGVLMSLCLFCGFGFPQGGIGGRGTSCRHSSSPKIGIVNVPKREYTVFLPPHWVHPTKLIYLQSTTVFVPSSRNWDSPTLSLASECAPPAGTKGGGAFPPAGEGLGESQFRRLEQSLTLCLLCGPPPLSIP